MPDSNLELIIQLRKELHNKPEPSMHEINTKRILMDFIQTHTHSLEVVDMRSWFYAVKKGNNHENPIAFRADYDAVTCADGSCRHLCGHDGHSAVLAGFALWLDTAKLERDVYLIFQPGEENGKGAAICSSIIDEYCIGISKPANGCIKAPRATCLSCRQVFLFSIILLFLDLFLVSLLSFRFRHVQASL